MGQGRAEDRWGRGTAVIAVESLTVVYPGRPPRLALQDLTLRIPPGVTLVRGPAGAGKSTLLRVLATLLVPDRGQVRYPWPECGPWGDVGPWHLPRLRTRIGYVPQDGRLDLSLTVEGGLEYLAALRGAPGEAVAALLARWELWPVRQRRLRELSAGELRRWLLAQSQLAAPDLWVLDEPSQGLDAPGMVTLRRELTGYLQAVRSGRAVYAVVATHDDRLDDLATATVWLDGGRLRLDGPPGEGRPG